MIIPSHDGAARLPATLAAFDAGDLSGGRLEVIVVDDGSTAPLSTVLGQRDGVQVVRLSPNRGRAAACNAGLAVARGRVVLVLDDDMTLDPGAWRGHLAAHRPSDPPCGVIGRIDPALDCFRGRFGRFLIDEEARRRERLLAHAQAVAFRDCLTGHFSIPRAALRQVGDYSLQFARYGFEDIELAYRLAQAGIGLIYRDDLRSLHRSSHATFSRHCRRHVDSGAMAQLFARSHPDRRVVDFLRTNGMDPQQQSNRALRLMAHTHSWTRRLPTALVPAWLASARGVAHLLEWTAPARLLHLTYHIVRDMHYAHGLRIGQTAGSDSRTLA